LDKLATKYEKISRQGWGQAVQAQRHRQGHWSRDGQGWGHVFVPVDSTLNNTINYYWNICLSVERFCFLQGHFFVRTTNLRQTFTSFHFNLSKTAILSFCTVVW